MILQPTDWFTILKLPSDSGWSSRIRDFKLFSLYCLQGSACRVVALHCKRVSNFRTNLLETLTQNDLVVAHNWPDDARPLCGQRIQGALTKAWTDCLSSPFTNHRLITNCTKCQNRIESVRTIRRVFKKLFGCQSLTLKVWIPNFFKSKPGPDYLLSTANNPVSGLHCFCCCWKTVLLLKFQLENHGKDRQLKSVNLNFRL